MNRSKLAQGIENVVVALIVCGAMLGSMLVVSSCKTVEIPDIDWPDDPLPPVTTTTTTTTIPPVIVPDPVADTDEAAHGLDMGKVTVHGGEALKNARITVKMFKANADKNGCTPEWEKVPASWPRDGKGCNGFVCVIYKTSKGWEGGKFDWLPENRTSYHWSFKHVYAGYKSLNLLPRGHIAPPAGCDAGVFVLSIDQQARSNVAFFKWE